MAILLRAALLPKSLSPMIKHMPVCVRCDWPSICAVLQTTSVLVYSRFLALMWQSCSMFACRSSERSKDVIYQGHLLTLSSDRVGRPSTLHDISSLVDTRGPASITFPHFILLGFLLVTCRVLWVYCCALTQGKRECQVVGHRFLGHWAGLWAKGKGRETKLRSGNLLLNFFWVRPTCCRSTHFNSVNPTFQDGKIQLRVSTAAGPCRTRAWPIFRLY